MLAGKTSQLSLERPKPILYFSHSYSSEDEDGITTRERQSSFPSNEYDQLQKSYTSVKIEMNKLAEKLGMMCAVYKDMQLARIVKLRIAATSSIFPQSEIDRIVYVCCFFR